MTKKSLIDSLQRKGFSKDILSAFSIVKREDFVLSDYRYLAYRDRPLPIGENATISQPFTIAFMLDLLDLYDGMKILEIGSGCGYVLALLSEIAPNSIVLGVEINSDLAKKSKELLKEKTNIRILNTDGARGYSAEAPYDRILVSAAYASEPTHLYKQLHDTGVLVTPINNSIIKYKKVEGRIIKERHFGFSFVPIL